jgi:hypothetical protein
VKVHIILGGAIENSTNLLEVDKLKNNGKK